MPIEAEIRVVELVFRLYTSRTYRYYTCWTRSRYGVDHCAAPRIDADALDALVLDAVRGFYTSRLDEAQRILATSRSQHRQARAGQERDLTAIEEELAAKEAIVDRYLTDYETNKIDHDTVATRIEKISDHIRQLRHQRRAGVRARPRRRDARRQPPDRNPGARH